MTKKTKLQALLVMIFLWMVQLTSFSQNQRTITGKILDEMGEPLTGATVQVKGTTTGATAGLDGDYVINAPSGGELVLVFSYVGYEKQEVRITNQRTVDVKMEPLSNLLEETVIVGYGVQKKIHLTGAVAQVTEKDLIKAPAPNLSQVLVGKLPGVISSQAAGAPGADGATLLVRGYTSFNGGTPLFLVDGIERDMASNINGLDPNDIESIVVLKDGAAAAVYGFKASNGVILVTTKRGVKGSRPSISYHGSASFSKNTRLPKFMNGTEYMEWYNKARELDGLDPYFTEEEIAMTYNGDPSDGYENTNWMSPMDKLTPMHQHNLSVSGSGESVRYYFSGGFMDQRGFFSEHKFQRTNFRSNIDVDATRDITVSLNMAVRLENSYRPGANTYTNQDYNNVVGVMMYSIPFVPKEYEGYPTSGYRAGSNPEYARYHSGYNRSEKKFVETAAKVEYRLPWLEGLKATMTFSYDFDYYDGRTFNNVYKLMQYRFASKTYELADAQNLSTKGSLYQENHRHTNVMVRPTLEYSRTFNDKHDVAGLLLFERKEYKENKLGGSRTGFIVYDNAELSRGEVNNDRSNFGSASMTKMAGYVGRFNYAYDSKYMAEFSFRYDGSYKFDPAYRWGFFPSLSIGWMLSQEDFFRDALPWVDRLKIRASAAKLGYDNVDAFLWQSLYTTSGSNGAILGNSRDYYQTVINSNPYLATDLTWEKTNTFNVGLDLNLWNGLLGLELDVFYKYTYDILQEVKSLYPPSLGNNFPKIENSGEFAAKGIDFKVTHMNNVRDFQYNLTGNFTFSRNKILKKNETENVLPWQSVLGTSYGAIWGYKAIGLAQSQEDIDNAATPPSGNIRVGDILYEDINGDGKIDSEDRVLIAKSHMPEMIFSLNADFFYKGFDLMLIFQGAAMADNMLCGTWENKVDDNTPLTRPWYGANDNSPLYLVENSWRPDNTNADYPRLSTIASSNNGALSSFWKVNGSYLRLKSLTLGYTLPRNIIRNIGLQNLRFYVAGTNLFTISGFKYLDPEAPNVLQGYYPQQRTMSFGVNVTF